MDLSEFLLARIAEDESLARMAADTEGKDQWVNFAPADLIPDIDGQIGTMAHVVRHDPARVLADCHAKRRIVEQYRIGDADVTTWVLSMLSVPYAGHADYRPEWKP